MLVLALLAACSVLWAIAGGVARRIAWPLRQLTLVTREIGEGNLSSRAGLCNWKRHDEIGELGLAINEMAERIERQLRDQRELLATVSHELRTPLTRVRLLLELAEASGADPKIAREIDGEVMEMDKLVGELLAGARVDFHALAPRLLDAGDVARRAVERSTLTDAQVVVADDAGELMADPTLLGRALVALLDNAKKYGAPPVTVRVRAQDADRGVLFEVEDRGQGFAPGDEERLMTAFTRGRDTAPDDVRGIGLGLSLVRKIAEAHGGRAFAKNVDGGGACVAIELPREPRARRPA
jgi:signal transduction histidine kinase